jgi:hypothetical protein
MLSPARPPARPPRPATLKHYITLQDVDYFTSLGLLYKALIASQDFNMPNVSLRAYQPRLPNHSAADMPWRRDQSRSLRPDLLLRKSWDGSGTTLRPSSCMENTPTSSVLPYRFFRQRTCGSSIAGI